MAEHFKLSKTVPSITTNGDVRIWTMTATCSPVTEGEDAAVFIYHVNVNNDPDLFYDVANRLDLEVIPVEGKEADPDLFTDASDGFVNVPFYRTTSATFNCNNACEMERIWKIIKLKVKNLSWELDATESSEWKETESENL